MAFTDYEIVNIWLTIDDDFVTKTFSRLTFWAALTKKKLIDLAGAIHFQ
jgi:hypothetical protein